MANYKLLESLSDVNAIADSMEQLVKLAAYLTAGTNWTAQQLVTAYLSYGMMHGWNIAQTMEKMNVIKGKITYQASAMFGIVIASPKCKSWKVLSNSEEECSIEFTRGDNNQKYVVTFTIAMAQKQGLTSNRQWQNMPKQMLMARCKSMAVRDVFGDVISGYDAIEMADSMDMPEDERLEILSQELDTPIYAERQPVQRAKQGVKAGADTKAKPHITTNHSYCIHALGCNPSNKIHYPFSYQLTDWFVVKSAPPVTFHLLKFPSVETSGL